MKKQLLFNKVALDELDNGYYLIKNQHNKIITCFSKDPDFEEGVIYPFSIIGWDYTISSVEMIEIIEERNHNPLFIIKLS